MKELIIDLSMILGVVLIGVGLLLIYAPLCLLWFGTVAITLSIITARKAVEDNEEDTS